MSSGTPPPPEKDSHPNRGTIGPQRSERLWLSAEQLHDHENEPSWKAPREGSGATGWLVLALVVAVIVLVVLVLLITGVI